MKHGHRAKGVISGEYASWKAMKSRCNNPNEKDFKDYKGRGIKVCERWSDFRNFLADMGLKPSPKYTIERIDNDGNYEPGNCKWATREEQRANSSVGVPMAIQSEIKEYLKENKLNIQEIANLYDLDYYNVWRIKRKMEFEK